MRADEERALEEIVARYRALAAQCDGVLAVGTDFAGVSTAGELEFNARVALNLGLPALLVVSGHGRSAEEVRDAIAGARATVGCKVVGVVANRVRADLLEQVVSGGAVPVYALPEIDLLMAPTVGQVAAACEGEVIAGDEELLGREALHLTVAAMTLPNLMERIEDGAVLITPGDRADVVLAALFAHASSMPALARGHGVDRRAAAAGEDPAAAGGLPDDAAGRPDRTTGRSRRRCWRAAREGAIARDTPRKITKALAVFEAHVDGDDLFDRVDVARSEAVTPLMFEYTLLDRAREAGKHIVLPEGTDERVLRAAETLLRRRVCELTLLGLRGGRARARRRGWASTCGARTCSTRPTRSCASASPPSTPSGARTRAWCSTPRATSSPTSPTSGR